SLFFYALPAHTGTYTLSLHDALPILDGERHQPQTLSYQLVCAGGHGTTGSAIWSLGERRFRGTLDVKLGGKNMTFFQRITAIPLDRKSTRLNSSHSQISYAVFCLKKK